MAYPKKLLAEGEEVRFDLHPHGKRMTLPVLVLVVVLGLLGFGLGAVGNGVARIVMTAVAVALLVPWAVVPFLRWRTTHYVVTNQRVVVRSGVLSRSGRDIPFGRINDVSFRHGVVDRVLGCGTLTVESAGERGQVVLTEVPHVETVQRELYDLVQRSD